MEPKADAFSTIASEASSDGLVSILALGSSKLVVSQSVQQLQRDLPALGTCCRWVGGCGADSLAVSSEGIPVLPRGTVLEPSTRLWAEKKKSILACCRSEFMFSCMAAGGRAILIAA